MVQGCVVREMKLNASAVQTKDLQKQLKETEQVMQSVEAEKNVILGEMRALKVRYFT